MDLMSAQYKQLGATEKKRFEDLSKQALRQKQAERASSLLAAKGAPQAPTEAATPVRPGTAPQPSVVAEFSTRHVGACAEDRPRLWLSLDMPTVSPEPASGQHVAKDFEEPGPPSGEWPLSWM